MEQFNSFYIYRDALGIVLSFVTDKDTINFLSTCKALHSLKKLFHYHKKVILNKILYLEYYDSFTNIFASDKDINDMVSCCKKLPKNLIMLHLKNYRKSLYDLIVDMKQLTHLVLDGNSHIRSHNIFSLSQIKHLTWNTNQRILKCHIPQNLLSLEIVSGKHFDNYIPNTIEKLSLVYIPFYNIKIPYYNIKNLERLKILTIKCKYFFDFDWNILPKKNLKTIIFPQKMPYFASIKNFFYGNISNDNLITDLLVVFNVGDYLIYNEMYEKYKRLLPIIDDFLKHYRWTIEWRKF